MALRQQDINGNPYVGVFCKANESIVVAPTSVPKKTVLGLRKALEVEVIRTTFGGSSVLGVLTSINSKGAIVTDFAGDDELMELKKAIDVGLIPDKLNAAGNNILCNDNGALVNPDFGNETIKFIEDILDVEVVKGTIAGLKIVGAAAVATNKGVLCHPKVTETELRILKELFKTPVEIGTANYGTPLIGACVTANTKGAVTGTSTTGIELGRIEEALGLYE